MLGCCCSGPDCWQIITVGARAAGPAKHWYSYLPTMLTDGQVNQNARGGGDIGVADDDCDTGDGSPFYFNEHYASTFQRFGSFTDGILVDQPWPSDPLTHDYLLHIDPLDHLVNWERVQIGGATIYEATIDQYGAYSGSGAYRPVEYDDYSWSPPAGWTSNDRFFYSGGGTSPTLEDVDYTITPTVVTSWSQESTNTEIGGPTHPVYIENATIKDRSSPRTWSDVMDDALAMVAEWGWSPEDLWIATGWTGAPALENTSAYIDPTVGTFKGFTAVHERHATAGRIVVFRKVLPDLADGDGNTDELSGSIGFICNASMKWFPLGGKQYGFVAKSRVWSNPNKPDLWWCKRTVGAWTGLCDTDRYLNRGIGEGFLAAAGGPFYFEPGDLGGGWVTAQLPDLDLAEGCLGSGSTNCSGYSPPP